MIKNLYWKNTALVDSIPIRNRSVHAVIQRCNVSFFSLQNTSFILILLTQRKKSVEATFKASLKSKNYE